MARISQQELLARIEKGKPIPVLLLHGDEPYLRDGCRAALINAFVPEAARTWAVSRFSAGRGETGAALEQAQSFPMLSAQQVVFLEDTEAIESLGEKNREAMVALFRSYFENPAPFTTLVLEAAKLDQRMTLGKLLVEKALLVEVGLGENPAERNSQAVAFARTIAKDKAVEFERGAAEDLAEFVSADLLRLQTEIEKLSTYSGDRKRITRADVASMVLSEKGSTTWELADMLTSSQGAQALDFLERQLRHGDDPIYILGGLAWTYRKLIEASDVKGSVAPWQAAKALSMNANQALAAVQTARKISKARLLAGLQSLQKADDRLKGAGQDPRTVMEFLIVELTGPAIRAESR